MDRQWWETYIHDIDAQFTGVRFSCNPLPARFGVTRLPRAKFETFGNSGAACMSLAICYGAKKVIMLGYDCQHTGGKTHWFGDHPRNLGNAAMVNRWAAKFAELRKRYASTKIINASRETALTMFERKPLEECL